MLRIVLGMISTASLAAFSAALAPTVSHGVSASRATPVSAQATRGGAQGGAAGGGGTAGVPVIRPGQILPRGSLLNLSV